MTFDELVNLVSLKDPAERPQVRIDSRLVKDGDIFAAIKGTAYDGHDFIEQAVSSGAKYIVSQQDVDCKGAEVIVVGDSAKAAAVLAQASRGKPASKLTSLAVTGTNGKTTVGFLVRSVFQNAGEKCGLIGTVVYDTGAKMSDASLTTPDCLLIAEMADEMVRAGSKYMVIEASSHALFQNRLAGIDFKAAAFTNLAGDHLDYHKTEKDYLAAKSLLFENLSGDATAVLNKQSAHAEKIAKKTRAKILWYAIDEPADIIAHIESMDITGTVFVLEYGGQKEKVKTFLSGRFNVSNHLAGAGLCLAAGVDLARTAAGLSALEAVPGRLEKVQWDGDFSVFIDYAHTDDALKNVLATLKPLCEGRLTVVFGCGGDRDRSKRPRMGRVAEDLADLVVVTSDNPRSEQPEFIIGEIITGFKNPIADKIIVESDRKKAIELAIKNAEKNDIVLIAGKGHETYQIIGKQKFDFSDKDAALECLEKQK